MTETTLITGASSGIGYEMALILAKNNNNLVLTSRNAKNLNALKDHIKEKYDVEIWLIIKDLSKENSAKELYDKIIEEKIKVTQLINNAGFGDYDYFIDSNIDKSLAMIQLNISSLVSLTYYFLKEMKKNNYGKILNVASILSYMPMPRYNVYAATKSFVLSFSEALHTELKPSNITVTCLCPGPTRTNFTTGTEMGDSRAYKNIKQANPKDVAKLGILAMEKGKRTVIYGMKNKFLVFSTRLGTKGLVLKIANFISSK
jgi:short-subunit dehydrogenase